MLGFHPHIDRTQAGAGDAGAALEARMRRTGLMLPAIVATCIVAAWSLTACYFVWRLEDRISRNDFAAASESQVLALQVASLLIGGILVLYLSASLQHARRLSFANQQISRFALSDPLTGLLNRGAFHERLTGAFWASRRGAAPFAVLYFDLDHFKDVNDTLGHRSGDQLLRDVAERVVNAVRRTDAVARFGGDEFAVLQTGIADVTATTTFAAKINEILTAPFMINGHEVRINASIGIAHFSADLADPEALMMQADLALYRAKADGRNCFRCHGAELDRDLRERVALSDQLRVALGRDELELYYQPQVDVVSGVIIGVEALLRWNHPTRGFLTPAAFIAIAERTGSIIALGQWAFDDACRQMRSWSDRAIAPPVLAVNFSAVQFKAATDVDAQIAASLDKWGVKPGDIEIELTESVLFEVTQQHQAIFERLRKLGVRIAIDDFGTGYSSLSYLTSYPANRLKIAQELVMGVIDDQRNATVVRAAIHLASELGVECIAEGVENAGQADFLVSAGCRQAQGYYFAAPVPAGAMTELLTAGVIGRQRVPPAYPSMQRFAAGAPVVSTLR